MSFSEEAQAHLDNEILAMEIDIAYTGDMYDGTGPICVFLIEIVISMS